MRVRRLGVLADQESYAFLDTFHPRRVTVDFRQLFGPLKQNLDLPKDTVLVFPNSEREAVLAAMKRELTPASGFRVTVDNLSDGIAWNFELARSANPLVGYGAHYEYGAKAADDLTMLRYGTLTMMGAGPPSRSPMCIVEIRTQVTWADRLRSALHL